jgi:HPt (histidine-containing phosphotransfer) domain-containing protein
MTKSDDLPVMPASGAFNEADLLRRLLGDRQLAGKVVQVFLKDAPSQLNKLCERLGEADAHGIRLQAHTLAGAAATVAADGLRAIAAEMELAGAAGQLDRCGELLTRAGEEFRRYMSALERNGWI